MFLIPEMALNYSQFLLSKPFIIKILNCFSQNDFGLVFKWVSGFVFSFFVE